MQIHHILNGFFAVMRRFPLAVICMFGGFLSAIAAMTIRGDVASVFGVLCFSLSIGAPFFAACRLWCEARQVKRKYDVIIGIPFYGVLLIPLWFAPVVEIPVFQFYLPVFAAVVLFFFSAPYFFRKVDNASYWYYLYLTKTSLFFAILSSVIFCIGVTMLMGAVSYLFGIKIQSVFYGYIWAFGVSVMGPAYLLAHLPKEFDFKREECQFPIGVFYIQKYILVPLALAVTAMFYLYAMQTLLLGEMPKGKIGWMVSGFSFVGVLTYITIYPVQDKAGHLMAWFYRWFFVLMIVPTALLGWAVYLRIHSYGVTVERYMLASIFLAMFSWIVLYFVQGRKFQLKHFAAVIVGFLLVASTGPFSAVDVSVRSQKQQLFQLLTKYELFNEDGHYQMPKTGFKMAFEDEKRINHLVRYLNNIHALNILRPWFENKEAFDSIFAEAPEKKRNARRPHHYHADENLITMMGITPRDDYEREENAEKKAEGGMITLHPYKEAGQGNRSVMQNISQFDFVLPIELYRDGFYYFSYLDADQKWQNLKLKHQGAFIELYHGSDLAARFDLNDLKLPSVAKSRLDMPRQDLYLSADMASGGIAALQINKAKLYHLDQINNMQELEAVLMIALPAQE